MELCTALSLAFPAPLVAELVKGRPPPLLSPLSKALPFPCVCFPYGNSIAIWFRFLSTGVVLNVVAVSYFSNSCRC